MGQVAYWMVNETFLEPSPLKLKQGLPKGRISPPSLTYIIVAFNLIDINNKTIMPLENLFINTVLTINMVFAKSK